MKPALCIVMPVLDEAEPLLTTPRDLQRHATAAAGSTCTSTARRCPEPDLRPVQVAVLAKAPIADLAKTRLVPALGPQGAARLQRSFQHSAVAVAQFASL